MAREATATGVREATALMFDQFFVEDYFSVVRLINFLQTAFWAVFPTIFLLLVLFPLRNTQRETERILTEIRRRRGSPGEA